MISSRWLSVLFLGNLFLVDLLLKLCNGPDRNSTLRPVNTVLFD